MPKKVQAILAIQLPTDKRQIRRFICMINLYRNMKSEDQKSWLLYLRLLEKLLSGSGVTGNEKHSK